uniref:LSM7 homolog, U6 small nuclear RNA and mRNA degradation associated n=1 Tax=Sus scrofa TaxID=9823 RepID=A0A4X1VT01_PIG
MADKEKKKKESILDLSKYIDKTIRVKFQGGREASGILKGFDPLLNLVLDGTIEYMRGECSWRGSKRPCQAFLTVPKSLSCHPSANHECCALWIRRLTDVFDLSRSWRGPVAHHLEPSEVRSIC